MGTLLHIMRYKVLAFLKTTFDLRTIAVVRGVGSLLVFGGFAFAAYHISAEVTRYVLDNTRIGLYLFHRFVSMVLFVFFMTVNLGNIIVSYSTLYKSSEVFYLLTKPVSYINIFVLKFLDNFLYSSTTLFLVAFAVLLGYGSYFSYGWLTQAGVLFFVLIPFMFLSACLAALILFAIMKIASRWGFRRVMIGLSVVYLGVVIAYFRYSNPVSLVRRVNLYYPHVDQYFMGLDPGILLYLPNHWLSEFLFYLARGEGTAALPFAGILLGVTAAAFVVLLLIAGRFYFRSWNVRYQYQAASTVPRAYGRRTWFDFEKPSVYSAQVEALLKKEYFQFIREPSQWIHMLVLLVLVGLFVMSLKNLDLTLRVAEIQTMTYVVLYAFGGFLTGSLALRFVFPMISLEGKAFWSLISAPVDIRKVYLIRFLIGFLLLFLLAELVAVFSNLPFSRFTPARPLLLYFGVYSAFWVSFAYASLYYGFGGYFANYQEKNPVRLSSSQGATLTFLVSLFFLIFLVAVIFLPLSEYFLSLFVFRTFRMESIVVPGTLIAVVSMLVAVLAHAVGLRSVQRDFP